MLEKDIEVAVVLHAKRKKFLCFKMANTGMVGVPDRLFISPLGKKIWIEFKPPTGKLSKRQQRMIELLRARREIIYIVNNISKGINIIDSWTELPE